MKKLIGLVFLTLILISAIGPTSPKLQNAPSIEGTWELVSFNNYDGNEIITVPATQGYRQIKMYYNGKVMWTRYVPQDSIEWFGYGSYSTTDTTLIERLEYMSASMRKIANDSMVWTMKLELKPDSYSQIFIDGEGNPISSENYTRLD
jgi:hypothetical protein